MPDEVQVSEKEKERRNQDLLALVNAHAYPRYQELIGQRVEILCEGPSKTNESRLTGRTRTNRIVVFDGNPARHTGQIFDVNITNWANFTLFGDPVLNDDPA
jgi:tRNA-2-methylthio-N6-dimethylallyladenosine synthase